MNANKFVVVIAFFVAASLGFAQGMRGTGGGGMAGQPIDGTAISPSSVTVSGNTSTQTLNVGTTSTTTRSHMLCEETIYTPSDFNTKHAVFGRNATSGASSGGVWLSYHTGDNEGIIGALSPGTAWRPLAVAAQTLKMRPAGGAATVTLGNGVTSTGAIEGSTHNSTIASGSQAYTCTNVGCRLSLGNTARYLFDNGSRLATNDALVVGGALRLGNVLQTDGASTLRLYGRPANAVNAIAVQIGPDVQLTQTGAKLVSFDNGAAGELAFIDYLGNISGNGFVATTASGSALTGGGASGPLLLTSNATDAATSGTVPAIRLQASQNIDNNDLLLSVEDSANNRRLTLREDGYLIAPFVEGSSYVRSDILANRTSTFVRVENATSDSASFLAFRVQAQFDIATQGAKLMSLGDNAVSSYSEKAFIDHRGLMRVNASNEAKPTCNADNRGRIFFLDGASGAADVFEVCGKDATNAYSWKSIVTW